MSRAPPSGPGTRPGTRAKFTPSWGWESRKPHAPRAFLKQTQRTHTLFNALQFCLEASDVGYHYRSGWAKTWPHKRPLASSQAERGGGDPFCFNARKTLRLKHPPVGCSWNQGMGVSVISLSPRNYKRHRCRACIGPSKAGAVLLEGSPSVGISPKRPPRNGGRDSKKRHGASEKTLLGA